MSWHLTVPAVGRYEVSVLHTAKTIGNKARVSIGNTTVRSAVTTVYDPPEISCRDLIPRWEVPDKVFKPLSIGSLDIPVGSHNLQVAADPGIEIQAVRLKRVK